MLCVVCGCCLLVCVRVGVCVGDVWCVRFWFAPKCDSLFVCARESFCCVRFWVAPMCDSLFVCARESLCCVRVWFAPMCDSLLVCV